MEDPAGGFYLFPDFTAAERMRGLQGSRWMCEQLLQDTGVATLPGVDFGRPREELSMRIAYVDFDGAAALAAAGEGTALDESWLRRRCGRVMDAIDRLCAWTNRIEASAPSILPMR